MMAIISGDGQGLSFPDICLTVKEKHQKNLNQENWPNQGLNPGPWVRVVLGIGGGFPMNESDLPLDTSSITVDWSLSQ